MKNEIALVANNSRLPVIHGTTIKLCGSTEINDVATAARYAAELLELWGKYLNKPLRKADKDAGARFGTLIFELYCATQRAEDMLDSLLREKQEGK
ncbi:Uncharacterised protein [Cedecea lapagei]|uniref:Uncharacterized protein n=1 Tax=Cedecea lapagei TaxID=158823 RepID=A0A447V8I1_9ENTR|nr:hypothetical protein [Cedecea lapagei]VEC02010.1 Uncharacterised protein [Cedecea lapagei]